MFNDPVLTNLMRERRRPRYPEAATVAGVLWTLLGTLLLLCVTALAVCGLPAMYLMLADDLGGTANLGAALLWALSGAAVVAAAGVYFFVLGKRTVQKKLADPLTGGYVSLVLGVLLAASTLSSPGLEALVLAIPLTAAGTLALGGRRAYVEWKRADAGPV